MQLFLKDYLKIVCSFTSYGESSQIFVNRSHRTAFKTLENKIIDNSLFAPPDLSKFLGFITCVLTRNIAGRTVAFATLTEIGRK